MESPNIATLVRLEDSELTIADPAEDARGRTAIDSNGDDVGNVKSLLIDEEERKVRFLEIEAGGVLGIGGTTRLVPVDAVTLLDDATVHLAQSRDAVQGSPAYDPELMNDAAYYGEVYGYYGYVPFWAAGYAYPAYPYY